MAGPDTVPWLSRISAGETIVGARFLPGAGGAALGLPLAELRDQRVPLAALGLDREQRLNGSLDPAEAASQVSAAAFRLAASRPPDRAMQAAVIALLDPSQRVERLAGTLGYSERQLRRRFLVAVGYGPKTLQRVLRLRRFLATVVPGDLSGAAFAAGYADQAHLARDCRALTGLTPAELAARR